ncbi:MAG: hypothetical protein HQ522_08985, partial [Bacteroidetes bacterium]|nr:hypothetical protein [Bacteroidota bacterium]
ALQDVNESTDAFESRETTELLDTVELPEVNKEEVSGDGIVEDSVENIAENIIVAIPLPAGIKVPIISDKPIGQYPRVIRRLKYEYSENYKKRGVLHKSMGQIPELNTPQNTGNRKDLFSQIKEASIRMDFLYSFIQNYENNNVIPAHDTVWPKEIEEEKPQLVTMDQLQQKRTLLLNGNYKDNNQLLFQQIKKADKENPMPDGPKRETIKLRITNRNSEILIIDNKILEIHKNAGKTK